MIQRLGGQAVVAGQTIRRVPRVAEHVAALAEHPAVQLHQRLPQADVLLDMGEVGVGRAAQLVGGTVLVDEPRHLARVAREVGRELRADREVDRLPVALAQVEQPPRRGVRQDLGLRVPLERHAHPLGAVAVRPQLLESSPTWYSAPPSTKGTCASQTTMVRTAIGRRRSATGHRAPDHVACLKLITSPSRTTYSLPSSRSSPCSRQAASEPRAIRCS